MFPVNPPVTMTSTCPFSASRASTLPSNPSKADSLNNLFASLISGEPFSSSVPLLNKYTLGFSTPFTF